MALVARLAFFEVVPWGPAVAPFVPSATARPIASATARAVASAMRLRPRARCCARRAFLRFRGRPDGVAMPPDFPIAPFRIGEDPSDARRGGDRWIDRGLLQRARPVERGASRHGVRALRGRAASLGRRGVGSPTPMFRFCVDDVPTLCRLIERRGGLAPSRVRTRQRLGHPKEPKLPRNCPLTAKMNDPPRGGAVW